MYIPVEPGGYNPPSEDNRMPVWHVTNGDQLMLTTRLMLPWLTTSPATPANSRVRFVLAEDRFSNYPIWEGSWNSGVTAVDGRPGLIRIQPPEALMARLRRGAYAFSLQITDVYGRHRLTVMTGSMLMEYEPNSDNHDIPYKISHEVPYPTTV